MRCNSRETSASKLCVLGAAASARAASSAFEWTSVVKVASLHHEKSRRAYAPARFISRRRLDDSRAWGRRGIAQKKADRLGGGPPVRRPAGQHSIRLETRGLGGEGAPRIRRPAWQHSIRLETRGLGGKNTECLSNRTIAARSEI